MPIPFNQWKGFLQSGTGAVATTVQNKLRSTAVDIVADFGFSTSNSGAANWTALTKANTYAASVGKSLYCPGSASSYPIDPSGGIIPLVTLRGDGRFSTIFTVAGNGNLFQRAAGSVMEDLQINMVGSTYSGDACKFAAGAVNCEDRGVLIQNLKSGNYAHNFDGDGGSQFNSYGSCYHTLASAGVDAAIKVTGTDSAAVPRTYHGTNGNGCTVWDFGGALDFNVHGGFTAGLLFSNNSCSKVTITGLRVGTATGTVTINGTSHKITGVTFSDAVVLSANTVSVYFISEITSNNITDNGTGNQVWVGGRSFSTTWTGGSPAFGNATVKGRWIRAGTLVTMIIDITFGTTTTYGSGQWFFSVPEPDDSTIVQLGLGVFEIFHSSDSSTIIGDVRIEPGAQKVSLRYSNAGTIAGVGSATKAWASTDTVRFAVTYQRT